MWPTATVSSPHDDKGVSTGVLRVCVMIDRPTGWVKVSV